MSTLWNFIEFSETDGVDLGDQSTGVSIKTKQTKKSYDSNYTAMISNNQTHTIQLIYIIKNIKNFRIRYIFQLVLLIMCHCLIFKRYKINSVLRYTARRTLVLVKNNYQGTENKRVKELHPPCVTPSVRALNTT